METLIYKSIIENVLLMSEIWEREREREGERCVFNTEHYSIKAIKSKSLKQLKMKCGLPAN
jgi:hypothetical protein